MLFNQPIIEKIIVILLFPLGFFAQSLNVQSPLRFLALGDSYTIGQSVSVNQRWPEQLKDSLEAKGIVIDTMRIIAKTGWRTDNLINAITNQHLEQQHYNLVSLLIGVNNQYQNKPITQYLVEFPQLLDSAIRYAGGDTSRVFIVSIPDYAATPAGQEKIPSQISQEIDQYNLINKKFADDYHIRYFDITPISRLGLFRPHLLAIDDLHPSGIQYGEWVKLMLGYDIKSILKSFTDQQISIHPNPVVDNVTVDYAVRENKILELYDATGKLVIKQEMNHETIDLSLKDLNKGIYIIRIVYKGNYITKKIVKE